MSLYNFECYNNLGFHNPYYTKKGSSFNYYFDLQSYIESNDNELVFDFLGFIQVNMYGYCLGDRTLLKGLDKTPWMAIPNKENDEWIRYEGIKFLNKELDQNEVAIQFFNLLKEELLEYVSIHNKIGLLLTGGMDSRIVACVLRDLELTGKLEGKSIKTFTWGNNNSRDVVYAKKIASLYDWSWEHIIIDADQIRENIEITIENGCEYSPIHLHGMSQLRDRKDVDCFLAGSFGDSIGRAEFSGKHITKVDSLEKKINNPNYLLRSDFNDIVNIGLKDDLRLYRNHFKQEEIYQDNEIDLQAHYMRRMLNPCMAIINKKIAVYQMFSSPKVYSYMWSLNPKLRNDLNYKIILEKNSPELLEIPWARTGLLYPLTKGEPDNYAKNHHNYSEIIREHFIDSYVLKIIRENEDITRKIVNLKGVYNLCENVKKYPIKRQWKIESSLLYIATVVDMLSRYKISTEYLERYNGSFFKQIEVDLKYKLKHFIK